MCIISCQYTQPRDCVIIKLYSTVMITSFDNYSIMMSDMDYQYHTIQQVSSRPRFYVVFLIIYKLKVLLLIFCL